MKKLRSKNFVRGISFFLVMAMVLSMMVAMTGCGKQDGDTKGNNTETVEPTKEISPNDSKTPNKDKHELDKEDTTVEPTGEPSTEPTNSPRPDAPIPDNQKEKDEEYAQQVGKKDPEATAEPTTEPTEEPLPTLDELLKANRDEDSVLDTNYKIHMAFGYKMTGVEDGEEATVEIAADINAISYENNSYNKMYLKMNYMGFDEEMNEESYSIITGENEMREYIYSAPEDAWYYNDTYYIDASGDEGILDTDGLIAEDFDKVEVTVEDNMYVVTAVAVAGTDIDGSTMMSSFGFDGLNSTSNYTFKFDKKTMDLIGIYVTCTFDIDEESMKAEGITSAEVSDFVLTFEPNNEPVVIPEDIVSNAVALEYSESVTPPDEDEDELHKGWGNYYNSYKDETGKFTMTYGPDEVEVPVTLNGKENWFFDNSWSFGTYLAVKDNSIAKDEPAHEVYYGSSKVTVNNENTERVVMALLANDYEEKLTSADIVPIIVNDRQGFYLVSYQSDWSRTINVLQDIGFNKYVSIDISTNDTKTDTLKIVEMFLLNFVYDGAQ